jgi:hypothetical protein
VYVTPTPAQLELIGYGFVGIGVVAAVLNKVGLLHFGRVKEPDCAGCSDRQCKDHAALVASVAGVSRRIDKQDAKLDRVAEDTAFIRGKLEGGDR